MLNNVNYSPSFQKKLMATTSLKNCGEEMPCKIYLLNSSEDEDYLIDQVNETPWADSYYFPTICKDFIENKYYTHPLVGFYSMEDEDGNCLAILEEIKYSSGSRRSIEFLEVVPTHAERTSNRKIKYIGETMVAFLAALSNKKSELFVGLPADDAKFFWYNLGFEKKNKRYVSMSLPVNKLDALVKRNEEHTGSKIEFERWV